MEKFLELLAKLDEDITALTDAELAEAREGIVEYGRQLNEQRDTAEDVDQLVEDAEKLAAAVTAIDTELSARETAAAEKTAKLDEAFSAFGTPEKTEEPVAEETEEEPVEEPVVAAAKTKVADVARRRPPKAPEPLDTKPQVMIAAAVGEEGMGRLFGSRDELAESMWNARRHITTEGRHTVARIPIGSPTVLPSTDPHDNYSALYAVKTGYQAEAKAMMLAGKPITAAGFCAPAEPVYDFFQAGTLDGIWQAPMVNASRGRLTYPELFNVRDLLIQNGVGWETTGTMDEDAVEKPCYTISCGDGITASVNAYSTCLKYSNFDSQFWPERVAHSSGQAMLAHEHEINQQLLAAIVADARTSTVADAHGGGGTWVELSNALAEVGAFIRGRFRLSINEVLEAVIPSYVLEALVADHVARASTTDYAKARAAVEAAIRSYRINPQWVYDWQELPDPNFANAGGGAATYNILLYPAGTIVKLDGGTLDLGVTRDSTLNVANDFQIFTESFRGHAIIGPGVHYITGLNLCPNGAAGDLVTLTCVAGS